MTVLDNIHGDIPQEYTSVFYFVKSTKRLLAHFTIDILHCLCVFWHVRMISTLRVELTLLLLQDMMDGEHNVIPIFYEGYRHVLNSSILCDHLSLVYSIIPSLVITSAWYTQFFHPRWSPQLGILNSSILGDHLSLVSQFFHSSILE